MEKLTHEERTIKAEEFFKGCIDIQRTKGKDYTIDGDAFKNLLEEAEVIDSTPEKVLWISLQKHYKAMTKYCKDREVVSEPILERLKDLANYIAIMAVLIQLQQK